MTQEEKCPWCLGFKAYEEYHDKEWGVPVHDDKTLFEFLILEGAQAGLSWATILKRREGYKNAFAHFDVEKVANFTQEKQETLLLDTGIIRNKLKVKSAVINAQSFLEIQAQYGSFDKYIWNFVDGKQITNHFKKMGDVPAATPLSDTISKDLKKRGFKFVGTTIIYAYLQACGLVNDHLTICYRHAEIAQANY
jgi:DNA-3-methyladenine glycosylase I